MLVQGSAALGELQSPQSVTTSTNTPVRTTTAAPLTELSGPPLPQSSPSRSIDNISHFHDWYLLGETQGKLASAQAGEYSLTQMYQRFGQLLQSLSVSNTNLLSQKLAQWETERLADGVLDSQLEPVALQKNGAQQSYILEKVDLLAARAKDELVTFFFRDNRSTLSINLPANAGKSQLFNQLQNAFSRQGIQLKLNPSGQLELSIPESEKQRLERPVFLTGEGYRIPAGNPLAMKLMPTTALLTQLSQQLLTFTPDQITVLSTQLEAVRRQMRQRMERLRKYRKQLLSSLNDHEFDLNESESAENILAVQQNIQQLLANDNFRMTTTNMAAQTNLSRRTVIALLLDFL